MNPEDVPESIGYLKDACGLDFGWGPTSTVQYLLEHLHITGGYSWTVSIVLLGVAVRAVIFPLLITAAKESQKMRDFNGVLKPIQAEYTAAKDKGDQQKMAAAAQRLMAVRKEFGLKFRRAFYAPALQLPLGFGCWRLLRNAADLPVPGFVTESWLWTTDLTFSDPYFIAPAVAAALIWLTMRTNSRANATPGAASFMVIVLKILPALSFVFMAFQPGAVQLYFIASSSVGLASAVILQRAPIRAYFGMPPLPSATSQIPIASGPNPAKPTSQSSVTKQIGGLHRRSIVERKAEAQQAATAKQDPSKKISIIDKGVNWGKKHVAETRTATGELATKFGLVAKDGGAKERIAKEEDAEAKMKDTLERQRRQRNQSMKR